MYNIKNKDLKVGDTIYMIYINDMIYKIEDAVIIYIDYKKNQCITNHRINFIDYTTIWKFIYESKSLNKINSTSFYLYNKENDIKAYQNIKDANDILNILILDKHFKLKDDAKKSLNIFKYYNILYNLPNDDIETSIKVNDDNSIAINKSDNLPYKVKYINDNMFINTCAFCIFNNDKKDLCTIFPCNMKESSGKDPGYYIKINE